MQKFAQIIDGAVANIAIWQGTAPDGWVPIEGLADLPGPGWIYDGSSFTRPSPAGNPSIGELLAFARNLRWRIEIGGILVGGVPVATDDRSKTMILGSRIAAMVDPSWTAPWDGADGGSYLIDATTIIAISDAVQAHVNAAFVVFDAVKTAIEAGTITTREQIEAASWPPNV